MLIIRSTDIIRGTKIIHGEDVGGDDARKDDTRLDDIRELAERVFYYADDMETAKGAEDLLRLPTEHRPESVRELVKRFHNKTAVFMRKWAEGRGFCIKQIKQPGPRIIRLRSDGIGTGKDQISIAIIIQRPKARGDGGPDGASEVTGQEPTSKGVVRSPMGTAGPPFVESPFECQVGDVVILEGAEQLLVRPQQGHIGFRDICMVLVVYQTSLMEDATAGSNM